MAEGIVVIVRAGAVRCLAGDAVADVLARAVTFDDAGLAETPLEGELVPVPPVVEATVHLRHPTRLSRLAGHFVRHRLDGSSSTLVLRSRTGVDARPAGPALHPMAAIPVADLAGGATFDLIVPVGEPGRHRYAGPVVTLAVASSLAPVAVARHLVAHRAFLGARHCEGDAALVRMAAGGRASAGDLGAALAAHEAAVLVGMLRDVVRCAS